MFGLLKVAPDEMNNDNDFMAYQAHYCGLCKILAAEYGCLSRFITNYEITLIYLLWTSQSKVNTRFTKARCPVRLPKRNVVFQNGSEILADISIILFYEKLLDDEFDEKKKLPVFIRKGIAKKYQKADSRLAGFGFDTGYIHYLMVKQRELEARKIHSLDRISEQTALMMKYILQFLSGLNKTSSVDQEIFKELGYHLGKWIYIMDSLIDLEQDSLLKRFNPLLLKCGFMGNKFQIHEIPGFMKAEIKRDLSKILRDIRKALSLIPFCRNWNLIESLLVKNLKLKTDIVFNAMEKNSKNSRKKLKILQASVAGVLIPGPVFASNGTDQSCGSCIGPILLCGIIAYAFKTMFRGGHDGGCCPCRSHPKEVQVDTGCGGKKTYKRSWDGTYKEHSSCC